LGVSLAGLFFIFIFIFIVVLRGASVGIGPKGLAEGDALTFVWTAPDALRLLVRGQPVRGSGELVDAATPRVLHAGIAFGPDPAIPEAKATTPQGLRRVFYQAAGGGGGGKSSGGVAPEAPFIIINSKS
jgi:hypothetical protein